MAEKDQNSKQPSYLYSARSDLESLQDSQDPFPWNRGSDANSEQKDVKRRVSWGNYRVRQYLQTTEEVSPEEGKYALIENEDILSAPLGSASPNLDPPLSQLIKDSAKQDEAYRRKSANSPSDMDISEIMSPPTKSVLKPERTGRELIEEFNQSLESPPIYMNCEEDTPESQKYPLPDPGVPALLIKCDNTPIQSFSQEPAPRFPNLLTPVKEEDGESMMICSSGDTLMTDNTFSYYKDNQRHATPYLAINKSESPISSKSESSSSVVSSIKPILRKIDEEKPKYEESIPQTTEKAILLPSKLDVNKLTPLKPISWKSNFVMNSSGRKTSRYDNSKEQRVIEFRERLEAAKKSLEAALYEKETLEELSRELLMILRDQDLRIDSAISGLISEERKKEKSVDMLINTETEKLTRDLLEINERYRWNLTYQNYEDSREVKAFRHIGTLQNSYLYPKLYLILTGYENNYEVSVRIMDRLDDELLERLWDRFSRFLNKFLSHNKEEFILEQAAHYWHSFISLQDSFFKLKMAFDIRDVVATETAMTIKGFAGEQMWEVGFAYVAIDKEGDVFKSVLKYLDITI